MSRKAIFGLLAALMLPVAGLTADLGVIRGQVRDSSGTPLVGAVVIIAAAPHTTERMAFTDSRGFFRVPNLFAGQYSVRVSMPTFLPAFKDSVLLSNGGTAILTINLQNALDVVRRAMSRDQLSPEDIVWTLRSSRSTQPILRFADDGRQLQEEASYPDPDSDYSGYVQLYSKSVETSAGTSEGVGSQFSVTMPLDPTSKVIVAG